MGEAAKGGEVDASANARALSPSPRAVLGRADDVGQRKVHVLVHRHEVAVVRLAILQLHELREADKGRGESEKRSGGAPQRRDSH